MSEIIAYCGLMCHTCPIYLSTREKNDEKKHKMRIEIAQEIKKIYGQDCKAEDVTDCDGCKTESGRLYSGCRQCEIRKCASQKNIENCAHCSEYACDRLDKLFNTEPQAKERLDEIRRGIHK